MWDVLLFPRAALRDVSSLRSALGYDVAAPFGAYSLMDCDREMDCDRYDLRGRLAPTDGRLGNTGNAAVGLR